MNREHVRKTLISIMALMIILIVAPAFAKEADLHFTMENSNVEMRVDGEMAGSDLGSIGPETVPINNGEFEAKVDIVAGTIQSVQLTSLSYTFDEQSWPFEYSREVSGFDVTFSGDFIVNMSVEATTATASASVQDGKASLTIPARLFGTITVDYNLLITKEVFGSDVTVLDTDGSRDYPVDKTDAVTTEVDISPTTNVTNGDVIRISYPVDLEKTVEFEVDGASELADVITLTFYFDGNIQGDAEVQNLDADIVRNIYVNATVPNSSNITVYDYGRAKALAQQNDIAANDFVDIGFGLPLYEGWIGLTVYDNSVGAINDSLYFYRQSWVGKLNETAPQTAIVKATPQQETNRALNDVDITISAQGAGTIYVAVWDYLTNTWISEFETEAPDIVYTSTFNISAAAQHWQAFCVYDYYTGRWSEGMFVARFTTMD